MFDTPVAVPALQLSREKLKDAIPYLGIGVGVLGMVGCLGLVWYNPVIPAVQAESTDVCVTQPFPGSVVVYVSGAIKNPGIYSLTPGSRVDAAITASGNFLETADHSYIHQQLNLAEEVRDEQHIYVPFALENKAKAAEKPSVGTTHTTVNTTDSLVSINTATQSELESLPRIGAKTAEKIIAARPYTDLFQLVGNDILSQSVYDEIKASLTL